MADSLVYNIDFYLNIRFVFGFYKEFQTRRGLRWLARSYCCIITSTIIFFYYYLCDRGIYPIVLVDILSAEYFSYFLISLFKGNKYLVQYYKKTPLIDSSARTYKPMRVCLMVYVCVAILLRFSGLIKDFIFRWPLNEKKKYFSLLDFIIWVSILMGRLPLLFIFVLLYSRMRLMRQRLESNNFDCRCHGPHHPRRYIQMYEAILDGLGNSDGPVKMQLFIFIVSVTAFNAYATVGFLDTMKNMNKLDDNKLRITWFIFESILCWAPMFLSAVLADLVLMETQEMLGIIIERCIACQNEHDYEEIQKLFQLLKSHPFGFSLWRVASLNVRSLLTFISFSITTIIAILQILGWTA